MRQEKGTLRQHDERLETETARHMKIDTLRQITTLDKPAEPPSFILAGERRYLRGDAELEDVIRALDIEPDGCYTGPGKCISKDSRHYALLD